MPIKNLVRKMVLLLHHCKSPLLEPSDHNLYLPKVGPMKAGCLNIAVPRKVPRPRGVAGGRAELFGGGARPGNAAAAAAAAVHADSKAG